jgi:hypothetical protein
MVAGARLMVAVALLLGSAVSVLAASDADGQKEAGAPSPPSAPVMSSEQVLQQLEEAGPDVKKIAAVIASAKDAGLPEEEMEVARRAAQRAILGDYSKNTKAKELAAQRLKQTLTDRGATAADKRRALDAAERQGVNSQNHYLFAEYVRQVEVAEDAELRAEHDRQLELQLEAGRTFSDWAHDVLQGVGSKSRDLLIASAVPALCVACVAVWRTCNKPSAASLERELLAAEAKELAQKSKRGSSKAAVRLAKMPWPPRTVILCEPDWCALCLPQAVAARRREARKMPSVQSSKTTRPDSSSSEKWAPRSQPDKQQENVQLPVGELLDEGAFQVVQKPQKKLAHRKRSGGSADASSSGAASSTKGTEAVSKGNGTGRQQSAKSVRSSRTPAPAAATVSAPGKPRQGGKNPNGSDKGRGSSVTANSGNTSAGRKIDVGVGKRSSTSREAHAAAGSKARAGTEAVVRKRGTVTGQGGKRRSDKHQAREQGAAATPVVVKNAWFKNVPAPASAPAPAPAPAPAVAVAKPKPMKKPVTAIASEPVPNSAPAPAPEPEPSPEPTAASSPLAAAKSKVAGWLPTVWSVGSTEAKTDSDDGDENDSLSYGSGGSTMPSPVPRLAFAGLPPPRIQLAGRADESPASAASIRFGDSPGSSAAASGIKFGGFPSPMGSQKQTVLEKDADSDDNWRASSQPQTSPASAAAAAAAKNFGGWGEPSSSGGSGSATRGSRRSPTGDGSSFSRSRSPTAGDAADSSVTGGRPPLSKGKSASHMDPYSLDLPISWSHRSTATQSANQTVTTSDYGRSLCRRCLNATPPTQPLAMNLGN